MRWFESTRRLSARSPSSRIWPIDGCASGPSPGAPPDELRRSFQPATIGRGSMRAACARPAGSRSARGPSRACDAGAPQDRAGDDARALAQRQVARRARRHAAEQRAVVVVGRRRRRRGPGARGARRSVRARVLARAHGRPSRASASGPPSGSCGSPARAAACRHGRGERAASARGARRGAPGGRAACRATGCGVVVAAAAAPGGAAHAPQAAVRVGVAEDVAQLDEAPEPRAATDAHDLAVGHSDRREHHSSPSGRGYGSASSTSVAA